MGQNRFGVSSGAMEFEAAIRAGGDDPARIPAIDTGPYLRQEGRLISRLRSSGDVRQATFRIRAGHGRVTSASAGFHAVRVRRFQQIHLRPASGVTVWLSWLMQWVRQPE